MEVTQEDVLQTASLLNIDLHENEIELLTQSFTRLIEYFAVLDKASQNIEEEHYSDSIPRTRSDEAESCDNPEGLIARSEEHEDNFVLIPNVL